MGSQPLLGGELTTATRQSDKTTASRDQTGESSTSDGAGNLGGGGERQDLGEKLVADDVVRHVRRMGSKE